MQRPIYDAAGEQALMAELWSPALADDLEAFILFVFPWGQANTPLEKFKGPRRWQRLLAREVTEHIRANRVNEAIGCALHALQDATKAGRGIGKSAFVCWLILWMLSTRIGSSVVVSANTEAQLRTVTWGELAKWSAMAINAHWWEISATKLVPAQWLTTLVERDLKKGTRYWAAEGKLWSEENPDGYAGVHNHDGMMVIFDEASGIADAIWPVAAGFFTENIVDRYWFAFSNPRRGSGYFYECFGSRSPFWTTRTVDARDVEDTDKAVYKKIIDEYGADSSQARIEVYGEFPLHEAGQFIMPSVVAEAIKRPAYNDPTAPIVIGIDPARSGVDSTVIVVRQGRDLIDIQRYRGIDTMASVGRVIQAIEKYRPTLTVIDEGGLGYGILDRLNEQKYKVRGVNFGWESSNARMWSNKKAEMWDKMRNWLKIASIPDDKVLKVELTTPNEVDPDSMGAIKIESKKQIRSRGGASPDGADALAVSFAFPVAHREERDKKVRRPYSPATVATSWMGS